VLWLSWIVAIVGPLLGLFVGTILTGRRDRDSELRSRMVSAADELVGEALTVLSILDRLQRSDPSEGNAWSELREDGGHAASIVDARAARMRLLFGETAASELSTRLAGLIRHAVDGADLLTILQRGTHTKHGSTGIPTTVFPSPDQMERFVHARDSFDGWLRDAHGAYLELPITARREILAVGRWRASNLWRWVSSRRPTGSSG
jgi:hypothetical protein